MKKATKRRRLTIEDRMVIQACLYDEMSFAKIAFRLGVNKSTISREIRKFKIVKMCSFEKCDRRDKLKGLCNACQFKGCSKDKHYYNFKEAQIRSDNLKKSSRSKPKISQSKIEIIDEAVTSGVRLGQSLHHIYVSNKVLQSLCHERTIRRLCYRGNLSIRPHELRRYATYKHSYKKEPKDLELRDIRVLIGRTYKDYVNYVEHHKREHVVQYDSVIGKISDKKAILTITFPKSNFQFGFLIDKGNPNDVKRKILGLFRKLGNEKVKEIFAINLADNGIEFSYFNQIEIDECGDKICSTYFTNPYKATDKPECERNHELVRYYIPKAKSLNGLTQEILDDMFSNINSYVRKSKGDRAPYDIVKTKFGKEFLDAINIRRIPNKKVKLTQII